MIIKETKDYYNIIKECYSNDQELLDKWHIVSGTNLDNCVNDTMTRIKSYKNNCKFFNIYKEDKLIGFFGTIWNNYLLTFFVMPEYRKKEYMKDIWNLFTKDLQKPFYSSLYDKNERAINFFLKNNGKIINKQNNIISFQFGDNICQ